MMTTNKMVGALSLLVLTGCGAMKKDNNEDNNGSAFRGDTALLGSWERGCEKADWLGLVSHKIKLNFDISLGFYREQTLFADGNCADERVVEKQTGSYTKIGDAAGIDKGYQINFTIKDAYVTPRSDAAAADLNKAKYCNLTNWANGVEQKVTGVDCKSGYKEGQVLFDIYKVDGNNLQLGQAGFLLDGSTSDARPTTLDTARPYVKK